MINTNAIFNISTEDEFNNLALKIFKHQFENNPVYRSFCDLLYKHPSDVRSINEIPFLPIQFFKSHDVLSNINTVEKTFSSSGTTGSITSKHHVTDLNIYKESFTKGFECFYGPIEDYVILALLPSYLEREGSSLVYMANDMITQSKHPESGFYLHDLVALKNTIISLEAKGQKTLLIGVSYALLDLIEVHSFNLKHTIVMETGGMKGRRKEMIREEVHQHLRSFFKVDQIHSEYGMTELLSQVYSKGNGKYALPSCMRVILRDLNDPFSPSTRSQGGINLIDLANFHSCAFLETQDIGKWDENGYLEVLGRFDHSELRGCNLLLQ